MTLPQGVQVATDAVRSEAGVWDQQSATMGTLTSTVDSLRLTGIEGGIFPLVVGPYNSVVDQVHSRSQEAVTRMKEIADTLRQVATTYVNEELNGAHALRNLR